HSTCPEREGGLTACRLNPFMHNGCGDIPTINNIRIIYCAGSGLTGIANGSDTPECKVNYADWQGGFTGALTETTPARTNKFLPNIAIAPTGDEERRSLNLNTATFDGDKLGGDVNSGVVFYSTGTLADTSHFAGILANTNLGRRLETTSGTGQWNGSFWATNMETAATDFTLHIDFVSRDIAGIVRNGTTDNYYFVKGVYANGGNSGLITGTVQYGEFSAREINLTTATLPIPSDTTPPTDGVLRGIIGSNGAIGVFVSGSAVDADGLLTGGTGAFGFAGGFVVNPTAQVSLTVDYNDWVRGFNNVSPPATATIPTRLNQFLNAGADRLVAASGGTPSALDFDDIHDDN
ncbi:MAG: hypothetical protein K8953_11050, partial [Proteobacteria bacterium]|nr:hypothetical protein [Pseudomonadota bacterium]